MAKLICTDAENAALSFLDWDEESLGKGVKALAANVFHDSEGRKTLKVTAAAVAIINQCVESGSVETEIDLTEAFVGDKVLGSWKILLKKEESN